MEKRVVIFLVLSLAVILGYDLLLKQLGLLPQSTTVQEPPSQESGTTSGKAEPSATEHKIDKTPAGSPQSAAPAPASTLPGSPVANLLPEPTATVETDVIRVGLSARGGVISSWELKRFHTGGPEQKPVQLVHQGAKFKGPLSITTSNAAAEKLLNEGLYAIEADFATLDSTHPVGHVTLRLVDAASGLDLQKRLTFHHGSYLVDVALTIGGLTDSYEVVLGTNFGIVEWGDGFIGLIGSASLVDGKVEKETPDIELERKGSVQWVALQDKYFLSVLMPQGGTSALAKKEGEKLVSSSVRMPASRTGASGQLQLYAGPKEYDTLRSLNVGLEDTIDFGWFIFGSWSVVKAVAKPIFYVLRFINDYTHNYGVTIILLTMGIKMLFVPLQYKSYKSMKQMQVVQPMVLALQEKYKDDRDKLNKELIKLYRDYRVNPVGGCLPMVLQMPVFVALFNILYMTIDLRQAPFVGWITDLSVQDPYYVLPIIMGATMVIQQKITPTTMDPTQAKIMLILPVFMTFLFINFPAGLVLYWLTNNVLTIGQQVLTDRLFAIRPPVVQLSK
jgi:YidC/Oxa1 family membrane protein insertase